MALHICSQRFHSVEEISTSDFSSVFRAIDTVGKHEVALKVAKNSSGPQGDALLKEFSFLSRCQHPNIIEVHDLSNDHDDVPFFAMKWINGCTLSSAGKKFGTHAIMDAIPALCQALAEVHEMGYVYGDLHPSNVLLDKRNDGFSTTLIDFGLVSEIGTLNPKELWGTPDFIPPEVCRGDPVGPASDVYSFGILLQKIFGMDTSPAAAIPTHLLNPKTLQDLIGRCVEYYPESRPQDFREIERTWSGAVSLPYGKRQCRIVVGKSRRRTIGQQLYLGQIEEHSERLLAEGGGVVFVTGINGVGKSTLIDRYRRKLQTRGNPTLRVVCDNLQEDSERILSAVQSWAESAYRARSSDNRNVGGLYLFLKTRGEIDVRADQIDWLQRAVNKSGIICLVECESTALGLPTPDIRSLDLKSLLRGDFEELCVTLFKDAPMISALSAFLYSAAGGLPGPVMEKYREYSASLQQENARDYFDWRKIPREYSTRLVESLQSLPDDSRRITMVISAVRTPFSVEEIADVAGIDENSARKGIEYLVRMGFLQEVENGGQTGYDTFSIWVDDAIKKFAAMAIAQHESGSDGTDRQRTATLNRERFRRFLMDPDCLMGQDRLPVEYIDMRYLPSAALVCRRLYHNQPPWPEIPAAIRRSVFEAVIAHYESLAAQSRAGRWAWRLARLELRMMDPKQVPTLTSIAGPMQLLNRHCSDRLKLEWVDEIRSKYPQLDDKVTALLLSERGVFDLARSDIHNALRCFFEAEAIYNKIKSNDHRRARNLNRIGIAYNNQKNYAIALKYYESARRILRAAPDPETKAVVDLNIGTLLNAMGNSREALAYLKSAHNYAKKSHHLQMLGFITRNMILCVADLEPAPEAVRAAEEALLTSQDEGERSYDAMIYSNLGWAQLRAGDVHRAYDNLRRSIGLAQKTNDVRWLSIGYLNLARLFHLQGDTDKSITFAFKSLINARRQRSPTAVAEACRVIAILLSDNGDYPRAMKFLTRVLRIHNAGDDRRSDFFMDMTEAEIRIRRGELDAAGGLLERWSNDKEDLLPGWRCIHRRIRGLFHLSSGQRQAGINDLRDAGCRTRAFGRYDLLIPIYESLLWAYAEFENARAALPYAQELRRLYRKVGRMMNDDKLEAAIKELTRKSNDQRFAGMVLRLSESLTRFSDKRDLLEFLLSVAAEYFGADRGALISQHPASKRLFIEAHCGLQSVVDKDDTLEISRSVIRRVTRTSEFLKIDNAPENPLTKTKKSILQHNIQAVMCVPIFHNGNIWGVLYLDNRSVPEAFKSTDSKMLQALANFMALAIEQSDEISRLQLRGPDIIMAGKDEMRFVAESSKMRELLGMVDRIADSDATILILGENGTGKDTLAAYIH
ncbi:tetratricopeptide repeat protein, partial [Candidatus Zixiibacteriota bacterium]